MNKLFNTLLLTLFSVIAFAQQERPGRFPGGDGPEEHGPAVGGSGTSPAPIDEYTLILMGVAVLFIAFIAYRRMKVKKA